MAGLLHVLLAAALPVATAGGYPTFDDSSNYQIEKYIAWTWLAVVLSLLAYRWTTTLLRHIRTLANLNHGGGSDGRQRYFSVPDETWARVKRHVISAPLIRKRHAQEFRFSAAVNVCTLPGRLQTFFLLGYFAMNAALCAVTIDWSDRETLFDDGLHRTGVLVVMNMVALFLLAGRNNPLIFLLGVSFDTYNLIHRWIGRIVVCEAIAHVCFWVSGKVATMGAAKAGAVIKSAMATSPLIASGTVGICAFCLLLSHSPGAVRHAFYETFLHVHILLAALATGAVWVHLSGIASQRILLAAVICWVAERTLRLVSLVRHNVGGRGVTKAEVEALPGDAVRVTLRIAKPWRFRPGQHVYLYVPSVGLWTSHPFSLVWSQEAGDPDDEKTLPVSSRDVLGSRRTTMSLVIRRRTGFTDKLWRKAESSATGKFVATALVEGPYGSQDFGSYGTVMLFAAGVGITHQVPHVRALVAGHGNGACATRRVVLVWTIQSPEHLEWIRPWMTQILGMEKRRDVLKILLFVTRPRSTKEIHSPSSSVQMFPGKPDVAALLQKEQDHQVGAMAVSVCGTGSMADDVRRAVRDRQEETEMDFFEEAFSW